MGSDKSVSSTFIMANLCALYGWMTWQFWSHIAAAVIWTLAVVFLIAHIAERAKANKS